jgi:hypothetical protein
VCGGKPQIPTDGIVFVFSNVKDYGFTVALEADFQ